ncbi:MAG: acyl-CoA dehydrogenase family protein [Actinobacteria bacterium]|nr:acyl-CoA dehydrogenase family protein [Actinomycetota bacterium]MCA1720285.1 acyl-CoA dehydrogenase family protein [Actinomycetota bacterium]
MDLTLSPDQDAVRKAVKAWVDDVVVPRALSNDREERFPQEALDGLKQTGFIGMSIPEEYGGGGADPFSYVLMIEELGRGDANVRSIVSVHLGLVAGVIARMGTDEQKARWLPQMATGEVLACFGLTEPDHGSDAGNLTGTAVKQPDGTYKINTRKIFITNGTIAGLALIMARTGGEGSRGVSAFLVPTDTPGFTANPIHGKLGLRSCDTAELVLDDVVVGEDALLGGVEGTGIKAALSALGDGRMSIAASCTGIMQACLDSMLEYTTQREQFGKKIAAHQLVQELIADTAVSLDAARLMTWRAADLKTRGEDYALASSKAKLFATEASVVAANNCVQAYGGYGYIDEYPAGKYLRDARVTTLYEGTSQVQKLIIGRALTGINAF